MGADDWYAVYAKVCVNLCIFFLREFLVDVFFFFSSRRRHTRWTGDWSSDVCSSDLLRCGGWQCGPGASASPGLAGGARAAPAGVGARAAGHRRARQPGRAGRGHGADRKSTRLNSSHPSISYAVFCLKKKKKKKKKNK